MNNFKKPLLVMTLAVSLSLGANVSFADNENNKSETNVKAILDNSSKTETTTKIQVKLDENNKVISNKNQNNTEKKEAEVKSQKSAKTERIDAKNRFETAKKIKEKDDNLVGNMVSQGTTPRRLTDLIGSLCDLTSGSGDKGTPVILIQGYFDNITDN